MKQKQAKKQTKAVRNKKKLQTLFEKQERNEETVS